MKEFVEEKGNYLPEKYKSTLQNYQVKEGNIVIALTRTIIAAGLCGDGRLGSIAGINAAVA